MANPDYRLVLTTCGDPAIAEQLAVRLVEERLVACVNIVPQVRSVYAWEGRLERAQESLLIMKTTAERLAVLQERVCALHDYELPEFVAVPISDGLSSYLRWVSDTVAIP